jgi:type I restriction enzyme M protein
MAKRLIFKALNDDVGVGVEEIDFEYFQGFSLSQKQKSIISLHENAKRQGYDNILEVSTKSPVELGVSLSAFNLSAKTQKKEYEFTVERAFQASKVFENGGPYLDILKKTSREAKMDERLRQSGKILKFTFFDYTFEINPPTFFYDWLYVNTLLKNNKLVKKLEVYNIFSDIEFNHNRSINCQAYSLALFKSLINNNFLSENLKDPKIFLSKTNNEYDRRWKKNKKCSDIYLELF